MKKIILTTVAFLCGLTAFAQSGIYLPAVVVAYGEHKNREKIDSAFMFPTGCGKPTSLKSSFQGMAFQYFDSCNNVMWYYNPKSTVRDWDSSHVGSVIKSINGVVGGGTSNDPVNGISTFTSTKLIGIGSKIVITINNVQYANFGVNSNITFNNSTGVISISPNVWHTGQYLFINLNQ